MRLLVFTLFTLLSAACAGVPSVLTEFQDDPVTVKERVLEVVQVQRAKKEWMKVSGCPLDEMQTPGRRPTISVNACKSDPAKCMTRCDARDGDACYALALLIQENDTIENDVAHVLFRNACRLGIVSGCTNAASPLFEDPEKGSVECAVRTFQRACDQEDPWGCTMTGLALSEGTGIAKDASAAIRALERACEVSVDKSSGACKKATELRALIDRNK